jgi:hypothetical protein
MLDTTRIPQPVLTELRAIAGPDNLRLAQGELAVYARDSQARFARRKDADGPRLQRTAVG